MLSVIYMRSLTLSSLRNVAYFIDAATAKKAWIQTKRSYFKQKACFSRADLVTYRRAWVRRYYLNALIELQNGRKVVPPRKNIERLIHDEVKAPPGMEQQYYENKVKQFLPAKYSIDNEGDLLFCAFVGDKLVHDAYVHEQEQVIQFIMMAVQNSILMDHKKKKEFVQFLVSKQDVLHALGIGIQLPTRGPLEQRWDQIQQQIQELSPEELGVFNQLKALYEAERGQSKLDGAAAREEQRRQQEERAAAAEEMRRQKEEQLAALATQVEEMAASGGGADAQLEMDLDSMPDCRLKYEIIVKRAKAGMGKFADAQFPPNDKTIGDTVLQNNIPGVTVRWDRMGEKPKTVIFEDGIDASDIRQGGLGDCYFLSSIAVLGNRQTRDKFVFIDGEDEWRQCGACCLKFYNGGKEQFVIVDDHLPLYESGDFIFTSTPSGTEMWPMLIEKAFAKLYGSYSVIEGGLVDVCLSELTNGIPETFYTERETNTAALWNKAMKLYKAGHFLGAGSPNSKGGDSDISPTGIVQSHAFSILRLVEADGHKLI